MNNGKFTIKLGLIALTTIGCTLLNNGAAQATGYSSSTGTYSSNNTAGVQVRISTIGNTAQVDSGKSYTYTLVPKVIAVNCSTNTARNVTITQTIPAFLSYQSSDRTPSSVTKNPDGTTTVVWNLGNVGSHATIPQIKYTAIAISNGIDRTQGNNKVVIASTDDKSAESLRTQQYLITYIHCDIPIARKPNVLLVKRISAINTNKFTTVIDPKTTIVSDPNNHDGNPLWPANYIQGGGVVDENVSPADPVRGAKILPGDEIEYTIYFLNAGDKEAKKVRICDLLTPNQTYVPGVTFALGNSVSANGANIKFIPAGGAIPTNCGIKDGKNVNGLLVVDVTSDCTVTALPAGTVNRYGYFRFRTKVN
jgi:uncharacterized repeat protein (TIGR01451 family)